MKKILVLISTYNGEKYLTDQLDSIISQKNCIVDLLVRDDGSKDKTVQILNNYQKRKLLKWYSGDNLKPAKSFMNLLIDCEDKYDYYAFSDQDDVWDIDKLYMATKKLSEQKSAAIYCSNATIVDENLNILRGSLYKNVPEFNLERVLLFGMIQGATMVINRELKTIISKKGMPKFIPMHDYYVSCVCLSIGGTVIYDPNPHMKYRQHSSNVLGIKRSIFSKVNERLNIIFHKSKFFDIETTSKQLLGDYEKELTDEAICFLKCVKDYKSTFFNRLKLACSKQYKLGKLSQSIIFRFAILLGHL